MQTSLACRARLMIALAMACSVAAAARAQSAPKWNSEDKADPLTDKRSVEFTLFGKYLTAPSRADVPMPALVVRCEPGRHDFGRYGGKLLAGFVLLGSTVNAATEEHPGDVPVRFRLDDGKVHTAVWGHSTNYSALSFDSVTLDTLLYGHFLSHKAGTSAPVKKLVIEAPEFLGVDVVAQFDMPDPTDVATACGVLRLK